jgi:hypothetical protein
MCRPSCSACSQNGRPQALSGSPPQMSLTTTSRRPSCSAAIRATSAATWAGSVFAALRAEVRALLADADPDRLARAVHVAYNGALVTCAIAGRGPLAAALDEDLAAVVAPWRP